jgi:hypothetical protein
LIVTNQSQLVASVARRDQRKEFNFSFTSTIGKVRGEPRQARIGLGTRFVSRQDSPRQLVRLA